MKRTEGGFLTDSCRPPVTRPWARAPGRVSLCRVAANATRRSDADRYAYWFGHMPESRGRALALRRWEGGEWGVPDAIVAVVRILGTTAVMAPLMPILSRRRVGACLSADTASPAGIPSSLAIGSNASRIFEG